LLSENNSKGIRNVKNVSAHNLTLKLNIC